MIEYINLMILKVVILLQGWGTSGDEGFIGLHIPLELRCIHRGRGREDGTLGSKLNVRLLKHLPDQLKEGLIKVMAVLGTNGVEPHVLPTMERNLRWPHFAVLHIELVAAKYHGNLASHALDVRYQMLTLRYVTRAVKSKNNMAHFA